MFAREIRLSTGNKVAAILAGAVLIAIVGVFLAVGFVLVIGLAVAGLVLGMVVALLRFFSGRGKRPPPLASRHDLDPALEIAPPSRSSEPVRPRPTEDRPG